MDQIGLVDRARRGDRQAFADLIRASGARLDATARLILRDRELAQDAVQETLIRAWRGLPGLRDPESFDTTSARSQYARRAVGAADRLPAGDAALACRPW